MSISTPARCIAALTTASLLAIGCGRNAASSPAAAKSAQAPRRLEVPADIRPITVERSKADNLFEANPVRAQYQQSPQSSAASSGPRIVELSASGDGMTAIPIRPPRSVSPEDIAKPGPPPR